MRGSCVLSTILWKRGQVVSTSTANDLPLATECRNLEHAQHTCRTSSEQIDENTDCFVQAVIIEQNMQFDSNSSSVDRLTPAIDLRANASY